MWEVERFAMVAKKEAAMLQNKKKFTVDLSCHDVTRIGNMHVFALKATS